MLINTKIALSRKEANVKLHRQAIAKKGEER